MSGRTHIAAALLLALLCSASIVHGQDDGEKYAGAFLEIPVGARALAMGGAYTAISNDEVAFHWNPAGVSLVPHKLAGFMYSSEYGAPGSALANFWHLGFTMPFENFSLSANWVRLSVGSLLHTPDLTNVTVTDERAQMVREIYGGTPDYFSDNEDALVLSVARNNKFLLDWGWLYYKQNIEVPIGVNFKFIHQSIGDFGSGQGIGVDVGTMVRFSMADFLMMPSLGKFAVGAAIIDLFGTRLNWSTHRQQTIPMHINAGVTYTQPIPLYDLEATATTDLPIAEREKIRYGLEVTYQKNLALHLGVNRGLFTTGVGFNWQEKIRLNYALGLNSALGPEHRLSFAVDVDNLTRKQEETK